MIGKSTTSPLNNSQDTSNLINYLLHSSNPKTTKLSSKKITTSNLYKKGLLYKSLITKKALKQKDELEKKRLRECTFHPKIIFYKPIAKGLSKKKEKAKGKEKDKDKEIICSTEPSTNQTTKKKPFREIEIFANHLYQYHTKYKMHINVLSKTFEENSCPFTPKINPPVITSKKINDPFQKRMTDWTNKQQEKRKALNEKELLDTKTGKPFFNPVLLHNDYKGPWSNASSKRKESQRNFEHHKQISSQMKQEEANRKFVELSNAKLINKKSSDIVNELYVQLYQRIFTKLSNGSELISKANVSLDNFPKHIVDFIDPLIDELLMTEETLNEMEFIKGCEYLLKGLSVNERNVLIQSKGF